MSARRRCTAVVLSMLLFATGWLASAPHRAAADDSENLEELEKSVGDLRFNGTPLEKVFSTLAEKEGVTLDVDWDSLALLQLNRKTPVTLHVFDGSLNLTLRLLMESITPMNTEKGTPDFWLEGKTIKVGVDMGGSPMVVRAYPVGEFVELPNDWIPGPPRPPNAISWDDRDERTKQADRLINTVEGTVRDSWDQQTGSPSMHEYARELFVTATLDKQRKIAAFLENMRRLRLARENGHPTTRGIDAESR